MALNRIWENRNKGEKTAAGSFGERAEQQEKGSRGKPVGQTQLRVIKEKMQMNAVELKAFVNHSHSLIHHHLKGSQGSHCPPEPHGKSFLLQSQSAGRTRVPGSAQTQAHEDVPTGKVCQQDQQLLLIWHVQNPRCRKLSLEVQGVSFMFPSTFKLMLIPSRRGKSHRSCQQRDRTHKIIQKTTSERVVAVLRTRQWRMQQKNLGKLIW